MTVLELATELAKREFATRIVVDFGMEQYWVRSIELSGGLPERLDGPILVIEDVTSFARAEDAITPAAVVEALQQCREDASVYVLAHRLVWGSVHAVRGTCSADPLLFAR